MLSGTYLCLKRAKRRVMRLSVLSLSKEQTGEKTNNGTHYKLQLLYSNGESNASSQAMGRFFAL